MNFKLYGNKVTVRFFLKEKKYYYQEFNDCGFLRFGLLLGFFCLQCISVD